MSNLNYRNLTVNIEADEENYTVTLPGYGLIGRVGYNEERDTWGHWRNNGLPVQGTEFYQSRRQAVIGLLEKHQATNHLLN